MCGCRIVPHSIWINLSIEWNGNRTLLLLPPRLRRISFTHEFYVSACHHSLTCWSAKCTQKWGVKIKRSRKKMRRKIRSMMMLRDILFLPKKNRWIVEDILRSIKNSFLYLSCFGRAKKNLKFIEEKIKKRNFFGEKIWHARIMSIIKRLISWNESGRIKWNENEREEKKLWWRHAKWDKKDSQSK